jgi:hypothetical protein
MRTQLRFLCTAFAFLPPQGRVNFMVILFAMLSFLLHSQAFAKPNCYQIPMPERPTADLGFQAEAETWCYETLASPTGKVFIYNADGGRVRPELAMIIENNGVLIHGSLLGGNTTVHRVDSNQFNPFMVPIEEPRHLQPAALGEDPQLIRSAAQVQEFLQKGAPAKVNKFELKTGTFYSSARYLPWRGYWWPYKGRPMLGPLGKFDRFVQQAMGENSQAAAWESSRHVFKGVWWEGHCNGWAASSILRREPRHERSDYRTGISFSVSDQKGLLAEADYCANSTMFGKRYRGGAAELWDIDAALFHKTLQHYIGNLGKPVIIEYRRDIVIDNHVISAYSMTVDEANVVTAVLTIHKYDKEPFDDPGVAPSYQKEYRYQLLTDSAGVITGGRWYSENPDFLWIPLGRGICASGNASLNADYVDAILGLPEVF